MGEFLSTMRRAITFGAEFPRLPGEREEEGLRRKVESSYRPPLLPCPSSSSSSDRKPTTRNLFTLRCFPSPFPGGRPHCATGGKRAKGLDIKQGLHAEFEPENCFALLTLGIGILYTQYYPFFPFLIAGLDRLPGLPLLPSAPLRRPPRDRPPLRVPGHQRHRGSPVQGRVQEDPPRSPSDHHPSNV